MANLLLTERCVRTCPYCFAKKQMQDSRNDFLSWDALLYVADFIESSHERHIALLGGEPAIHPLFVDFVAYLLERGLHVNVFTSGIWPPAALRAGERYLSHRDPDQFSLTVNVNQPEITPEREARKLHKFLEVFGPLVSLGFNIYRSDFSLEFAFQLFNQYGLRRHLRLGLAHPIPGDHNIFVPAKELRAVVRRLIEFLPMLERLEVSPGFDCGIPMCLFENEELGWLYKATGGNLRFGCGPAIDIGPDLSVWACFPLSKYSRKSLYDFNSLQEVVTYFNEGHRRVRDEVGGVFEACDTCVQRERGLCQGGCLAHSIAAFRNEAPVRIAEVYE